MIDNLIIIGNGLIGHSIFLALNNKYHNAITIDSPNEYDKLDVDFQGDIFVVIATPMGVYEDVFKKLSDRFLNCDNVFIIDTASVQSIGANLALRHRIIDKTFGCHPIAGSHKTGSQNARSDLFLNKKCIFAYGQYCDKVREFWSLIGTQNIEHLTTITHDYVYAYASHYSQLIMFMVQRIYQFDKVDDTNRLCFSNHELWKDIFLANKQNIIGCINNALSCGKILWNHGLRIFEGDGFKSVVSFIKNNTNINEIQILEDSLKYMDELK